MILLKYQFKDKIEYKKPTILKPTFDDQMLYLRSAYRCSRNIKWCNSQVLLESYYISPILIEEMYNDDYIAYASEMLIKYLAPKKIYIKHDQEVLAK